MFNFVVEIRTIIFNKFINIYGFKSAVKKTLKKYVIYKIFNLNIDY